MPPLLEPDADLVRRWQHGDRLAFEQIVRDWQGPVGRLLARLTGDPDAAGDLCQEVFLRVYRTAGSYQDRGQFRSWLFRITVNLARDAARRTARRPPPVPLMSEPARDAEPLVERAELAIAVANALAALPEPLREVVVLRHYEDMSFEAMARMLDVPATTLKSRFGVAIGTLRQTLAPLAEQPEELS